MKFMDIIKKQKTLILVAAILIGVAAMGVSYAIFFDVKSSNNQVITAGSLTLSLTNSATLDPSTPLNTDDGLASDIAKYTVSNTGNLPANYYIYVYADDGNAVDLKYVNINCGTSYQKITAYTSEPIVIDGTSRTCYKIATGSLNAKTGSTTPSTSGSIRVWVDEDSLTSDLTSANLNINLYLVSEVRES